MRGEGGKEEKKGFIGGGERLAADWMFGRSISRRLDSPF